MRVFAKLMPTSKQSVNVDVDLIAEIQNLYIKKNKSSYGAVQKTLERGVDLAVAELRGEDPKARVAEAPAPVIFKKRDPEREKFFKWLERILAPGYEPKNDAEELVIKMVALGWNEELKKKENVSQVG